MVDRIGTMVAIAAVLMAVGPLGKVSAQETIKIGAIYPLSGNAASAP